MRVGRLQVLPVLDGAGREPACDLLQRPGHAGDPWAEHADLLDAQGRIEFTLGGFLVRTGDRMILVDTGVGMFDNGTYAGGRFLDHLRAHGVEPDEVTDVLLTHLHFDHVGWTTRRGEIVFRNATYRVHADDWAYFVERPEAEPGAVRKLSPLVGQVETFDGETTLAPGVDARPVPGHTPGSSVYVLSDGDERALLLGDAVHSVVELLEPGWEFTFDVDRRAAVATRARLVEELERTGSPAAPAHFPDLRFGRLATTSGHCAWTVL